MYDSPSSLQEVCVDFICDNWEALCETTECSNSRKPISLSDDIENSAEQKPQKQSTSNGLKLIFKDSEVYFHSEISENILTTLCTKGKLTDLTMTLFDVSTTRLR